jgi:hypothetical protein
MEIRACTFAHHRLCGVIWRITSQGPRNICGCITGQFLRGVTGRTFQQSAHPYGFLIPEFADPCKQQPIVQSKPDAVDEGASLVLHASMGIVNGALVLLDVRDAKHNIAHPGGRITRPIVPRGIDA